MLKLMCECAVILLLGFTIYEANALQCWACSSDIDRHCGDRFNYTSSYNFYDNNNLYPEYRDHSNQNYRNEPYRGNNENIRDPNNNRQYPDNNRDPYYPDRNRNRDTYNDRDQNNRNFDNNRDRNYNSNDSSRQRNYNDPDYNNQPHINHSDSRSRDLGFSNLNYSQLNYRDDDRDFKNYTRDYANLDLSERYNNRDPAHRDREQHHQQYDRKSSLSSTVNPNNRDRYYDNDNRDYNNRDNNSNNNNNNNSRDSGHRSYDNRDNNNNNNRDYNNRDSNRDRDFNRGLDNRPDYQRPYDNNRDPNYRDPNNRDPYHNDRNNRDQYDRNNRDQYNQDYRNHRDPYFDNNRDNRDSYNNRDLYNRDHSSNNNYRNGDYPPPPPRDRDGNPSIQGRNGAGYDPNYPSGGYNRYPNPQPFRSSQIDGPRYITCNEEEARLRRMKNVCLKKIQRIGDSQLTYIRRCEMIPIEKEVGTCYDPVARGISLDFCEYCEYDGCNSATGLKLNKIVIASLLSTLLLWVCWVAKP